MFEYATLEGAMGYFAQLGFVGQSNCVFYATTAATGGGFVAGMEMAQNGRAWAGYLLNVNEMGFGILPFDNTKKLVVKPENLFPRFDEFVYIPYQQLVSVKIKRMVLGSSVKRVIIEIANAPKFELQVLAKEKKIPYHEANFARFCEFYGKK